MEEEDDPFEAAASQRPPPDSPEILSVRKRTTGESNKKKRSPAARINPLSKRSKTSDGDDGTQYDLEDLQQASMEDLIKLKIIKDIMGGSGEEKRSDDVTKADAADIKITGCIKVVLGNGKKFTINLDEEAPASANIMARHVLRVPNCKPDDWWTKQDGLKKALPVRTSGLYLASTMGSARIHDNTLARLHHRTSALTYKMLLGKNAHLCDQDKMVMMSTSSNSTKFGAKMEDANDTYELMEAVLNYLSATYMIRSYSYEAIALVRALHHVRYFYNVSSSESTQKKLLAGAIDRVLSRNRSLGSEGEPPLVYTAVVELLKNFYSEQSSSGPEHLLTSGNVYSGTRSNEAVKYQEFLKQSPQQTQQRFRRADGQQTPGGGQKTGIKPLRDGKRTRVDRQMSGYCRSYNMGSCKAPACKYKHACNKLVKKLVNGKQVDWVCGDPSHEASTCTN